MGQDCFKAESSADHGEDSSFYGNSFTFRNKWRPPSNSSSESLTSAFEEGSSRASSTRICTALTPPTNFRASLSPTAGRKYEIFLPSEILLLRSTFELLMRNRDQLALEILDRLTRVPEIIEKCQKSPYHTGNNCTALGLGLTMLDGIECCLPKIADQDLLIEAITRLQEEVYQPLGITPRLMAATLNAGKPVIMAHLLRCHACIETSTDSKDCVVCKCWEKLFCHTILLYGMSSSKSS